jgi:hypothetical protein
MSLANQQLGKMIHGDKVVGSPVHGGLVPVHGRSYSISSNPAGPVHGDPNLDGSGTDPKALLADDSSILTADDGSQLIGD